MGGCPGHRELSGKAAGIAWPRQLQASLRPSMSQEHGRLQIEVAVTHKGEA
jgi:hypothetical protein